MEKRKAFCSWSGGKDCCLALHKALRLGYRVEVLLSLLGENGRVSASHGLPLSLLMAQSQSLGLELMAVARKTDGLKHPLHQGARAAVERGCTHGVFGDIYVEAHRGWIEEAAKSCGFEPFFPLWKRPTAELAREFLQAGFRAIVVSVKKDVLPGDLLGRTLDEELLKELEARGLDPAGENGEYHTFVYDGPLFKSAVEFRTSGIQEDRGYQVLQLIPMCTGEEHLAKVSS